MKWRQGHKIQLFSWYSIHLQKRICTNEAIMFLTLFLNFPCMEIVENFTKQPKHLP